MTQLICLDGHVFASHDDDHDVALADYPAGAVIIPLDDREAFALPRAPEMPPHPPSAMETPELMARHAAPHRHAGMRLAPVPTTPSQLKAYAASVRHYRSILGVTVAGARFETDDAAERRLVLKWSFFQANPKGTLAWKTPEGFIQLDLAAFTVMTQAVATYRESCFAAEARADAGIDAGTIRTMADIDALFAALGS